MGVPVSKNERKIAPEIPSLPFLRLNADSASLSDRNFQFEDHTIKKWNTTTTRIIWEVIFTKCGLINIYLGLSNNKLNTGATVKVKVGEEEVSGKTSYSGGWNQIANMELGKINIANPGTFTVITEAVHLTGLYIGDLHYLLFTGEATEGASEVFISPRASYIGLIWDKTEKTSWFYNQVKVTKTFSGTQFTICGIDHLDLMLLHNDFPQDKHIMFSCLGDSCLYNFDQDEIKYCIYGNPKLIDRGDHVEVRRFKEDENGLHCSFAYSWKLNEIYHGLLQIESGLGNFITLTAYFYLNDKMEWKKIASYQLKCYHPDMISGYHSSIRDFYKRHGRFERQAEVGPPWMKNKLDGSWTEVKFASFFQGGKEENINATYTKDGKKILLETGGFVKPEENFLYNFVIKNSDEKVPYILEQLPTQI